MLWLKKYGIVFAKICKDFPENGLGSCVTEITSGPITAGLFFFLIRVVFCQDSLLKGP